MKSSLLPFYVYSAVFHLLWTPSDGLKKLYLGSCVVTTNLQEIQTRFSEIRDGLQVKDEITDIRIWRKTESLQDMKPTDQCCFLRHILRLYLDRIFKNYQTSDYQVLRRISSLANSFLTIKKDLQLCHAHMMCSCGKRAMEKYSQILSHFEELNPQAAVVKALGEMDVLLQWMKKME